MATNTLITPALVAREAALSLQNEMVMGNLVYRSTDDALAPKGVGDTVSIRIPPTLTAQEFTGTATAGNIVETKVDVKLDKLLTVDTEVTSKELSLSIDDFNAIVTIPSCRALAQSVDALLTGLGIDIPYTANISATPVTADIAGVGKIMNLNKVPQTDRNLVLDPNAHAKYVTLDAFLHADKSGSTDAVRNASMGKVLGFDTFMSQNIKTLTRGTWTSGTSKIAGNAGDTTVAVTLPATAHTFTKGDVFTVATLTGYQFVVTENLTTAADGTGNLKIYPALPATITAQVITKIGTTDNDICSLGFHKNAFCLVTRPLEKPLGGVVSEVVTYNGLSIRVTYGYTMSSKTNLISFDLLCGVKTLKQELACRLIQ